MEEAPPAGRANANFADRKASGFAESADDKENNHEKSNYKISRYGGGHHRGHPGII